MSRISPEKTRKHLIFPIITSASSLQTMSKKSKIENELSLTIQLEGVGKRANSIKLQSLLLIWHPLNRGKLTVSLQSFMYTQVLPSAQLRPSLSTSPPPICRRYWFNYRNIIGLYFAMWKWIHSTVVVLQNASKKLFYNDTSKSVYRVRPLSSCTSKPPANSPKNLF